MNQSQRIEAAKLLKETCLKIKEEMNELHDRYSKAQERMFRICPHSDVSFFREDEDFSWATSTCNLCGFHELIYFDQDDTKNKT